jgi:tRNA-2-methylthio-N6-dimethylallyladenosine synthase
MAEEKNRFYIETFGCQMNVSDSEKVAGLLAADGLERAQTANEADFVFINTCAVREKASEKLFHALGRLRKLKRSRPHLKVGVGGCVAQLHGESILERSPGVDLLVGPRTFSRVPEYLRAAKGSAPIVDLDRRADSQAAGAEHIAHASAARAYVTAIEGCNHVCSFCVVPRTRGAEACRPPQAIVAEARAAVEQGLPEVMLLGQTVNAYRSGDVDFVRLLELVHETPGLARLRFTTSHPSHVGPGLAAAMRDLPRLCPYLHLPVQSGSDRVLDSMRRGYTAGEYRETIALLREAVPTLALSTDVIVGYPGETEPDFQATLDLVDSIGFDGLFAFAYSPRPGTTALRLGDDVPEEEKKRRLRLLNDRQQRAQGERYSRLVGLEDEVLVETADSSGRLSGRTPQFRIVHFDGPASLVGSVVRVRYVGAGPNALLGTMIPNDSLTGASVAPIF